MIHLVMTYEADGTTTLYRNSAPYGKSYRKNSATFPKTEPPYFLVFATSLLVATNS